LVTCPPPMNRAIGAPVSDPARSCGPTPARRIGDRCSGRFREGSLFLGDLPAAHEPRDWSAGLRPGSIPRPDPSAPDRRPALQAVHGKWRIYNFFAVVRRIPYYFLIRSAEPSIFPWTPQWGQHRTKGY
jgi:hypothetical protein